MKLIASPARFKGYAVHSVYTFTIAGDSLLGRPIQIYVYWVSHYIVYKCPSLQKTIIPLLRSTQWIWSLSRHFLSNFLDSSAVLYSEWIKKRPNCGLCPNVFPTPPPLWNFWHYFECLIVLTARALNACQFNLDLYETWNLSYLGLN